MQITSAEFLPNPLGQPTTILAVVDGVELFVPTVPGNRYYDEMLRQVADGILVIEGEP
jgi:hypothetical protein